jgi:zinc transport system substrate-binding protein
MKSLAAQDPSLPLIVSHPVYTYWGHRYGLNIQSVHWEPDEIPSKEQMDELQILRSKHPARWMVWEGDPIPESVKKLVAVGMNSLVFDPCGNVPDQGDFLSMMRKNIESLKQAYE